MSAGKHTPGPWQFEPVPFQHGFSGTTHHVIALTANVNDTRTVAFTGGDDAQDNARLIAAAPDLLAALQHAESVYRLNVVKGGEPSSTLANMQAAIAKAIGSAA